MDDKHPSTNADALLGELGRLRVLARNLVQDGEDASLAVWQAMVSHQASHSSRSS